jgi:hypothetical protein
VRPEFLGKRDFCGSPGRQVSGIVEEDPGPWKLFRVHAQRDDDPLLIASPPRPLEG